MGLRAFRLLSVAVFVPWSVAMSAETDLAGTRRGPTGWYLTGAQRQALRTRVQTEPWARALVEREIVPGAELAAAPRQQPHDSGALPAAIAWVVTGEKRYAAAARDWLLYAVRHWQNRHDRHKGEGFRKPPYQPANCAWDVPGELFAGVPMHKVYDLVADTLPAEDELRIRATIREIVTYACNWIRLHGGNVNMNFIAMTSYYEWAASIGDEAAMEWLLTHRAPETNHGGIFQMLDEYMRDGQISAESPIYHTISLRVLDLAACAFRYNGRDLFRYKSPKGNTLQGMVDGLVNTAWPIMNTGCFRGTVCPANWGHGGTTYAGDVAVVNRPSEAWQMYSAEAALGALLRVYPHEPTYRYLLSLTGRATRAGSSELVGPAGLDDLLYGRLPVTDREPAPPAPSRVFPAGGIAMLRFPETGDYWQRGLAAWFHGGEYSRGHIADPSLMLFGAGRLLLPQFLTTQYEDPNTTGWCIRRISRNTITIDGRDGLFSYTTYRHQFDPEIKFVSLRCHPYLEAEMERIGMLTGQYLLDVFRARVQPQAFSLEHFPGVGGSVYWFVNASLSEDVVVHPGQERNFYGTTREKVYGPRRMPPRHTFDYTLHGLGRLFPDAWPLYTPSTEFTRSFWSHRWAHHERKRQTDEAFYVDWVQTSANYPRDLEPGEHRGWDKLGEAWFQDRAGVRTHLLGEPGTTVFLAQGPMRWGPVDTDLTPEEQIPFLAVRRVGKEALYVALHEPFKDRPVIRGFRYFRRPTDAGPGPALGVTVEGPDYTDHLFVCLGLPGFRAPECQVKEEADGKPLPLAVLTAEDDPGAGIAWRGQAYVRVTGDKVIVRGDVAALSVRAEPAAGGVILNGRPIPYKRDGPYVRFGEDHWRQGAGPTTRPVAEPPWSPPLELSLPQQYVNIDAEEGGQVVVRVTNVSGQTTPGVTARGEVSVAVAPELAVEPATQPVPALEPGARHELRFGLRGGAFGRRYPLKVTLRIHDGGRDRLAGQCTADVSVGVTVEEIEQAYDRPAYRDGGQKLDDLKEDFSRWRVRAPGYTIEIDRFSGTSRSMIDPDGKERIGAAGYPLQFTRAYATFAHDVRDPVRYPYEVPCVRGPDPKAKTLGWWTPAQLVARGADATSGCPTLAFRTADGQYELRYRFDPDKVHYQFKPVQEGARPLRVELDGLCVDYPAYRWRLVRGPDAFGFKRGPYEASPSPLSRLSGDASPYRTFRPVSRPRRPAAAPRAGNLLAVGGFEPGPEAAGALAGWRADPVAARSCTLDESVRHGGRASLRFEAAKSPEATLTASFESRQGFRYRIAFWTRAEGVRASVVEGRVPGAGWNNSSLQVLLDQPEGYHLWNGFHAAFWPDGSHPWMRTQLVTERQWLDGRRDLSLRLCPGRCEAGTIWVDDVSVEEMP